MEKEYDITDLLHTAKELEKWQKQDEMPERTVSDIHHDRQDREEYDRYSRHGVCN